MAFPEDILSGLVYEGSELCPGLDSKIVVSPWNTPVSLEEVKEHCRVRHSADDSDITGKLLASIASIERTCGIAMMEQTWEDVYNAVSLEIKLSKRPVLQVSSVKIVPNFESDTETTVASSSYIVFRDRIRARSTWPASRGWQGFKIRFLAGYALQSAGVNDARAAVPQELRLAVLNLTEHLYTNRAGEGQQVKFASMLAKGTYPPMVMQYLEPYLEWGC